MKDNEVRVGEIVKPHGVDGAFLIEVLTDFPEERFAPGNTIRVILNDGRRRELTVEEGALYQERWLVTTREIDDRDLAEELREADVVIDEEDVIGQEGDLYDFDLIGMDVFNEDDEPVGTVSAVGGGSGLPTLEIDSKEHGTIEFPAHGDLMLGHDRTEGWIKLRFPRGWEHLIQD